MMFRSGQVVQVGALRNFYKLRKVSNIYEDTTPFYCSESCNNGNSDLAWTHRMCHPVLMCIVKCEIKECWCRTVSLGSHHNIIQSDKQLSLRTAKITQRTALPSCLRFADLLSFSHTLFSDSICLRKCKCFVRCWCSSITGLPTPPTAFDPSRRCSHPEMPICASTSSSEIYVCVLIPGADPHTFTVLQDCLQFAVAAPSLCL